MIGKFLRVGVAAMLAVSVAGPRPRWPRTAT